MAALPPDMPHIDQTATPESRKTEAPSSSDTKAKTIQDIGEKQGHESQEAPQLKDVKSMHSFKVLTGDKKAILKEGALNSFKTVVGKGSQLATKAQETFSKITGLASGLIGKINGKEKENDDLVITEEDLNRHSAASKDAPSSEERIASSESAPPSEVIQTPAPAESKPQESVAPKKEASKEELDQLAAKMKEIRDKRAERKTLKEEVQETKSSKKDTVKKAVEDSAAQVKEGRYEQKVEESKFGLYKVGKPELVDGKKVYSAPKSEISLDNIEKVAANLIKANDRAGLRKLCNSLFMGSHGTSGYHVNVPEIAALRLLLSDPDANLKGVEKLIRNGAEKWRTEFKPATAQTKATGEVHMQNVATPEWAKDPEAWVEISHGGGAENIRDFVEGRSDGYKLENFGTGLQVSPNNNERDNMYAQRTYQTFDTPAILKGRIQVKHLQQAPNAGYEAGLTPENVKYMENVTIVRAPYTAGEPPSPNIKALKDAGYSDDMIKQVQDARSNLAARNKKPYSDDELKRIGADYNQVTKYTKNEDGDFKSA